MGNREGFTLIELVVAMLILTTVVLSVGAATSRLSTLAATSATQAMAQDLAEDRLEEVMMDPSYTQLETRYDGTESSIPDFAGYQRVTQITHTVQTVAAGGTLDYKRVTVTITGPGLTTPLSRSVIVAAP